MHILEKNSYFVIEVNIHAFKLTLNSYLTVTVDFIMCDPWPQNQS